MDLNSRFLPECVTELIEQLAKLPTVGKKSAQRLAFYLLRQDDEKIDKLAGAILGIKDGVNFCEECFNLTTGRVCKICDNPSRNHKTVCVVEDVLDLIALENTMEFNGVYHVLHGALSPLDNVGPDDLKLHELFNRLDSKGEEDKVEELILANNTNTEGEATALYIYEHLKGNSLNITRIASGMPVGGDLDYADSLTLKRALKGRGEF